MLQACSPSWAFLTTYFDVSRVCTFYCNCDGERGIHVSRSRGQQLYKRPPFHNLAATRLCYNTSSFDGGTLQASFCITVSSSFRGMDSASLYNRGKTNRMTRASTSQAFSMLFALPQSRQKMLLVSQRRICIPKGIQKSRILEAARRMIRTILFTISGATFKVGLYRHMDTPIQA